MRTCTDTMRTCTDTMRTANNTPKIPVHAVDYRDEVFQHSLNSACFKILKKDKCSVFMKIRQLIGRHFRLHTLYNVCAVPWGSSVPWGDIMSTVGGYLEYRGGVQYRGGYLEYRGGVQYRGGS